MFALMLWPQPDDIGSRLVQAIARRRRGSHREVLELIAVGATTKTIARDLKIGTRTVEDYRANIMRKVGVKSAAELLRQIFVQAGKI